MKKSGRDLETGQKASWEVPGSPDYLAAKIQVVGAQVARRPAKKKSQAPDAPDPYVEIEYAGRVWATAQLRATQQPKWNETFEVPIPPDRRNQLGELAVRVWDMNNSTKKGHKGQIFLGELRLSLGDFGGVNYEYVEQRRYKLRDRSPSSKDDAVDGSITLRVGMVLPKKRSFKEYAPLFLITVFEVDEKLTPLLPLRSVFPETENGEGSTQSLYVALRFRAFFRFVF